ncbi:MAG: zf-HC2 domain-containing protein [candidate division NC10 bacterium]
MECAEAREHLSDLNRGRLEAGTAEAVRAHVGQCAPCAAALQREAEVRALIQARAPRYAAPPALRSRIQAAMAQDAFGGSGWRAWLRGHPWTIGSLAGAVAVLLLVWGGMLWMARDPVSRLAARAVAEHVEYAKEMMNRPIPDPPALVQELRSQVEFSFEPVFRGDSQVQLVAGLVSDLLGKRAATFVYRDGSGRYTTLFLMPEAGTTIPAENRMPIETFKPYHRVTSGRHLLLWKQRDLACLLVSDLDEAEMAAMFLKVRKAA